MTRATNRLSLLNELNVLAILAVLAGLIVVAPMSRAELPAPSRGTIPPGALERVLAEAAAMGPPEGEWEDHASRDADAERTAQQQERAILLGTADNNDTCHYARGVTLIVHIFLNHTGGTWTNAEMNDAAAKGDAAKNNYMGFATYAANQRFDPTGNYFYYNPSVDYYIADTGCSEAVMEDAVAGCGFTDADGDGSRVDDMTHYLQGWGGGWDNVILVIQPDITGRAWASYGQGKCVLYTNSTWDVWAHEWGHVYGACDEYARDGNCNGNIDCGICQSTYLTENVNNSNCELMACGTTVDCLMKYNTTNAFCSRTPRHWGWADDNSDGLGNDVRRPTAIIDGSQWWATIYELYHNGWFVWNDTAESEVISQRWSSWSVIGLRSPATADYDLTVFTDNTHNVQLGSSVWGTGQVDFVVGDYNHNNIGNEHIQLTHYSGSSEYYNLTFESGGEVLYPDGIARTGGWGWNNTAVVWDLPMYAGETIEFYLDAIGNIDFGMALYKSNSGTFFSGRGAGQVAYTDSYGIGGDEPMTYTVPEDDVYGLVIWSNNSADASFTIQIGPAPFNMAEEVVYWDTYDPSLWTFTPNAPQFWAVAGTRSDTGKDLSLRLFDDPNYQYLLENSFEHSAGQPEWVAVDYNHAPFTTEYPRVSAPGSPAWYFTQWEGDSDILYGAVYPPIWAESHVVKIWDVYMDAGTQYFFRQFSGSSLDGGLYLYNSYDGDYYKRRSEFTNVSDFFPQSYGGERFWHDAADSDWYGLVATSHNYTQGSYSLWFGPWLYPADDVPVSRFDQVVWASAPATSNYWQVAGVRPAPGDQAAIWLYEENSFADTGFRAYDVGLGARFVVADYNHITPPPYYTAAQRQSGYGALDLSWEGGNESIVFNPGGGVEVTGQPWQAGHVAKVLDLYIDGASPPGGQPCRIRVTDDSGTLNLGVAIFASYGGQGYAGSYDALVYADAGGVGQSELLDFTATAADWYGLVIFNQEDAAGTYSIQVLNPTSADVAENESTVTGLRLESANPFAEQAALRLSLAQEASVDLAVYDVHGRQVRSLVRDLLPAGTRVVSWNGVDAGGRPAPPGVYFARLRADGYERRVKLIKTE